MDFFKYYRVKNPKQREYLLETNWEPKNEYDLYQLRGDHEFYEIPRPNKLLFQTAGYYC